VEELGDNAPLRWRTNSLRRDLARFSALLRPGVRPEVLTREGEALDRKIQDLIAFAQPLSQKYRWLNRDLGRLDKARDSLQFAVLGDEATGDRYNQLTVRQARLLLAQARDLQKGVQLEAVNLRTGTQLQQRLAGLIDQLTRFLQHVEGGAAAEPLRTDFGGIDQTWRQIGGDFSSIPALQTQQYLLGQTQQVDAAYQRLFHHLRMPGQAYAFAPPAFGPGTGMVRQIDVMLDRKGRPALLAIGTDDQLYIQNSDGAGRWSGWGQPLPGQVKQACGFRDPNGNPMLFAIGLDDLIHVQAGDGRGGWSGWSPGLDGAVKQISVAPDAAGRPLIAAIGLDDLVYLRASDGRGGWTPWSAGLNGKVKEVCAARGPGGQPLLFAIGMDDQVYGQSADPQGRWSGWALVLPGAIKDLAVLVDANGRPRLFAVGLNDRVFGATPGPNMEGWSELFRGAVVQIAALQDAQRQAYVFAIRASDGQVVFRTLGARGWSPWLTPGS
jgi:hypothetical protein